MAEAARSQSFGQQYSPTLVDRFGVWLSARQIRRWTPDFTNQVIGNFGCGYHATLVRTILPELQRAALVDVALAPELKNNPNLEASKGLRPDALANIHSSSLDTADQPSNNCGIKWTALGEIHHITEPNGICRRT